MSQATLIVGGIIVAFIVWVTLQGHLANYLADLGLGGSGGASAQNSGTTGGNLFGGGSFFPLGTGSGGFTQLPQQISGFLGGVSF